MNRKLNRAALLVAVTFAMTFLGCDNAEEAQTESPRADSPQTESPQVPQAPSPQAPQVDSPPGGAQQATENELPQPDAQAVWQYLEQQDYQGNWQLWPGTEERYEGTRPHGALLTTYVNTLAQDALTSQADSMPRGSIIVKENYSPEEELAAVTVMYKASEGYNPEHNDWFWLKRLADGTVEASGKVEGCQSCHQASENDYLMTEVP